MIDIKVQRKGKKALMSFDIQGDTETIAVEIFAILKYLSEHCPGPFELAVEAHSLELIEKIVDKEIGE